MSGQNRKHMAEIDLIRFVCSVLMIYYHLTPRLAAKFPDIELYWALSRENESVGGIGVLCFFILSGLFFQLGHKWEQGGLRTFAMEKVARLWPAMAFSIFVNYHTVTDILNLFFISAGSGMISCGSSNPASWYACVLFWVFLIYYLWFHKASATAASKGGSSAFLLTLTILGFAMLAHRETSGYHEIATPAIPFLTNGVLMAVSGFSLGVLLGRLEQGGKIKNKYLISVVQMILFGYFVRIIAFTTNKYEHPYYVLVFVLLLYFILFQDGVEAISNSKWLKRLGSWSYSIYIMQFPCFYYYELLIDRGILKAGPSGGGYVFAGILICIVCGILVYYMVEYPAYQFYLNRARKQNVKEIGR